MAPAVMRRFARSVINLPLLIGTRETVLKLPGVCADTSTQMYIYDTSRFSEYKDR